MGEEGGGGAWRHAFHAADPPVHQTVNKLTSRMFRRMNAPESQQRGAREFSSRFRKSVNIEHFVQSDHDTKFWYDVSVA